MPFIGFPITSQNAKQNKKSQIQTPKSRSKSVEACLPNKCVCPPVCPTASSPRAQTFEPPLTIHFDEKIWLFAPCLFVSSKLRCFFFLWHSLDFPSRPKTPKKKSREFPLPIPAEKTQECFFSPHSKSLLMMLE